MTHTNMKKMTALVSLSVISVLSLLGLQERNTRTNHRLVGATIPRLRDTKTVEIVKEDFGLTTTSNTDFSVSKTIGESPVIYSGVINQISKSAGNPWLNIKRSGDDIFKQTLASGSSLNKWRLTSIEFEYAKQTSTVGNINEIKVNDILIHSYEGVTKSTAIGELNANKDVAVYNFDFNDNITTFSIDPTYNLYITYINLTYTIDYTNC